MNGAPGVSLQRRRKVLEVVRALGTSRLTIKSGKLEAKNHSSVLHKNVDEITYCFQCSDTRVVVVADLDRFGTQQIFFRFREINFTIRYSPEIKCAVHLCHSR